MAATTTTVTITTTTSAVSTTTTTSQHIPTHTCLEDEVRQESSNPQSQEKVDPSSNIVPASCHILEPKCLQACILVEQEECQDVPVGQKKTQRRCRLQPKTMRGAKLKALVRAQSRTILVLKHKLYREQRRSKGTGGSTEAQ
ncbi:hypothetical protein GWK47_053044 [Chionoecetes opilio]|uniref:Uncharacterized protein n=1 Tax=Chionoecetes opilio TaxID=41210 RepID=A0A8J5CSG5_CHIOP|nr:hypothetical protein GWK47_053044 [Chionoecetes opilio]